MGLSAEGKTAPPKTTAKAMAPWQEWTRDRPHQAVIHLAQARLREDHPELTQPLAEPDDEGFSHQGGELMKRALIAGGYPPGKAERSFVMEHEYPERGASQVVLMGSRVGAALLPSRWDAGTVAHEAGHILHLHHRGMSPADGQSMPDHEKHGPEFARHYATALDAISPGTGAGFLRHHADAVTLTGNQRYRVHGLPRDFEGSGLEAVPPPPRTASADAPKYYHGTDKGISPGNYIEPGHDSRWDDSDLDSVYFTNHPLVADWYSTKGNSGSGHVYEVAPEGHFEEDEHPDPNLSPGDVNYRSSHPVRVVRRLPQEELDREWEHFRRQGVTGYDLSPRSGMIYLEVPEGLVERLPGGVDDEQHITLVYLGKDVSDGAFDEACRRAGEAAAVSPPMEGVLRGVDSFPPSDSSKERIPAFVPAHVPGITRLREKLADLSASEHDDWRPHVTLAYLEPGDPMPEPRPPARVKFTELHVKRGDDVVSFPLTGGGPDGR